MAFHPEVNVSESERDFALIIEKRRNSSIVADVVSRVFPDLGNLLAQRERPLKRDEYVYRGVRAMADYCQDEGIGDIVLLDRSARPLWVGISTYWKLAYPGEDRPGIHFINPSLFRDTVSGSESPDDLSQRLQIAGALALDQMQEAGSSLPDDLDAPVLLADACMHSGRTMHLAKRVLEEAGFSGLHTGVTNTTLPAASPITPDIFVTDNVAAPRCFRTSAANDLVQNNGQSIYSVRSSGEGVMQAGADVRNHIKGLVAERFVAEQAAH